VAAFTRNEAREARLGDVIRGNRSAWDKAGAK